MNEHDKNALADLTSHHIEGIAREGNMPFNVSLFSQIDGNLWSGGCPVAVAPDHFQFIFALYKWEPYVVRDHQVFMTLTMFDHGRVPDRKLLEMLADTVNRARGIGPTLVHCQAGLNRSGLVTGLALVRSGMKPADAIELLRQKRSPAVLCNPAFERWLLEYTP